MLNKIGLVARREFWYNFTRKTYLLTAFVIPFIIFASIYVATELIMNEASNLSDFDQVGVVDEAQALTLPLPKPEESFDRFVS